ncbi:MAG: ribosomal protein S18-alanine N-acetyltransferase [archaeon]|nr:ribosomal protein S18-alanine N-acetyltransferase [archaeon]MCP8305581.1 ribosomal protein S18-alanine N-acetyltransferase [archaeon]
MIRRCRKQDLTQVLDIERISFKYPYDRSTFLYFLMREPEGFYVAEEKGRIIGYAISSVVGSKGTMISIAVMPELRRRGIGSNLLRESLNFLSKKVREVELQVRKDDQEAIDFYKKSGFREAGLIFNYYPDGGDALVMSKILVNG